MEQKEYYVEIKEVKKGVFNRIKESVKKKVDSATKFICNNPEFVIIFTPVILGTVKYTVKTISRNHTLNKEKNLKELYCYDRSLGHYWKLRRELTNDEWVEIDKRKVNGERLGDILDELKVLK